MWQWQAPNGDETTMEEELIEKVEMWGNNVVKRSINSNQANKRKITMISASGNDYG